METSIFTRDYKLDGRRIAERGDIMLINDRDFWVKRCGDDPVRLDMEEAPDDLAVHLLPLNADLFAATFHSFAYINWLTEYSSEKNPEGQLVFPGLVKGPETVIMFLMELGVRPATMIKCMYGMGNKYAEYLYLVQQFGKMV